MKSAAKTLQSLRVRRAAVAMLIAAMIAGSGWLAYELALQSGFASLQRVANDRLSLLQLTLDATIERFRYLPTTLPQAAPIVRSSVLVTWTLSTRSGWRRTPSL